MYKALQPQTGEEIIILHPKWRQRISHLRELDQADLLVCQGCMQPLRVKAGELKRPHFAHKHLKACSYGSQSPELLSARAVMYDWLHRQFGDQVTVEKKLDGQDLPRPVDCWVDTPRGPFAYWIVEAGIKLDPRIAIKEGFAQLGGKGHFIFLSSMMNEEKKLLHSLLLTPTERAFMETTPFDMVGVGSGRASGSLHYLDFEQGALVTYRNLALHHQPNWFAGHKKSAPLDALRASTQDGNIMYPGEQDRLSARIEKQERLAQKREQYARSHPEKTSRAPSPRSLRDWGISSAASEGKDSGQPEMLLCVTCGQMKQDYWSTFFDEAGNKFCRCRSCLDSGRYTG